MGGGGRETSLGKIKNPLPSGSWMHIPGCYICSFLLCFVSPGLCLEDAWRDGLPKVRHVFAKGEPSGPRCVRRCGCLSGGPRARCGSRARRPARSRPRAEPSAPWGFAGLAPWDAQQRWKNSSCLGRICFSSPPPEEVVDQEMRDLVFAHLQSNMSSSQASSCPAYKFSFAIIRGENNKPACTFNATLTAARSLLKLLCIAVQHESCLNWKRSRNKDESFCK